jgi:hypothetical protein
VRRTTAVKSPYPGPPQFTAAAIMNENAYTTLLRLMDSARKVLATNNGTFNAADLRIRCLVDITEKELQRALWAASAAKRSAKPSATRARARGQNSHDHIPPPTPTR